MEGVYCSLDGTCLLELRLIRDETKAFLLCPKKDGT